MTHKLWLVKGPTMTDITAMVGSITRRSDEDELGEEVTFDVALGHSKLFPKNQCEIGDMVILTNGEKEITRTIIVDESQSSRSSISYSSFDAAFYLNKSNAVYQFKGMQADQCIRKILKDFNVPVGTIAPIRTTIDKIYNDQTVSDIIREILEFGEQKLKTKYLMEMRAGKLYIEPRKNMVIQAFFERGNDNFLSDGTRAISNASRTRSIVDMINYVQVTGNDDKVVHTRSDSKMVKKYGRLQKVVKLDQKEKRSAAQIAKNELDELSRIVEEASITLLGDDNVRAGRLIDINEPITNIKGRYLIKDVNHEINGGIHTMTLNLEGAKS